MKPNLDEQCCEVVKDINNDRRKKILCILVLVCEDILT